MARKTESQTQKTTWRISESKKVISLNKKKNQQEFKK